MIDNLKSYPKYKDSGVPWLGDVPEHWEVLPGRTLFREINDRDHPKEELLSVTISRGVVRQADLLSDSSKKDSSNEDKSAYKLVEPGDIAYNKMRAWQGAVGVSAYRGIVSPAYIVQRLRESRNSPRYMHYLLRTPFFIKEAERWSYGITSDQWSLRAEDFKNIYFSVPSQTEQTAIVRFLDWAERRIRRVIQARQRRIELLEEYKQTLIHQAVTGQIDVHTGKPYPKYKDSGVEWLGKVPKYWEVRPLKRIARFKSGVGFPVSEQGRKEGEVPFLRVSDMNQPGNEEWIEIFDSSVTTETAERLGAFVFPSGTIIFPKVGGALLTNKRRRLRKPSCIDNNVMGCIVESADPDFVFILLKQLDLGQLAKPGPVPAISEGDVREIPATLPPLPEQTAIVEFLDDQTKKIDTAINTTRRAIDLLKEFRTRLIADVVTGKVDVRETVDTLPDVPTEKEGELLDDKASETNLEAAPEELFK